MKIVISGVETLDEVPGIESINDEVELICAKDRTTLESALPGADILIGWNFEARDVPEIWPLAGSLKWIHWCGVAVDTVIFPELSRPDVLLTNAGGVFETVMAEYILAYMLFEVKNLNHCVEVTRQKHWLGSMTRGLAGGKVTVVGVGAIGRETARLLKANGLNVVGVGRTAREADPDFDAIFAADDLLNVIADADWVIGILPLTAATEGFFTAEVFAAMKPSARFLNLGRGKSVDEAALINGLKSGGIAGAMLDVFVEEPLSDDNPLWSAPNLFVSPMMSSYFEGYEKAMADQFLANYARFKEGEPLKFLIDKKLGFAAA